MNAAARPFAAIVLRAYFLAKRYIARNTPGGVMKRRELVLGLGSLAGAAPVVFSLGMVVMSPVQAQSRLPVLSKRGGAIQLPGRMLRFDLLAMQFASAAAAVDIDALCDVDGKLYPYRIASFRAGAVSPQSKLFGFAMDDRALAGFRVEHCRAGRSSSVGFASCSPGAETPYRLPAGGSFVLDMDSNGMGVTISALPDGAATGDAAWMAARKDRSYLVFQVSAV